MSAPTLSRITAVIGGKGSGKSTIIKRGLSTLEQFVVWDLAGEYAHDDVGVPGARLWTDLAAFRDHLLDGGTIAREVFACPKPQFPAFCEWAKLTGNLVIVIEELARYCGAGKADEHLSDLFDRSRHCGIDLICASARLAEIPKSLVHQADEILISQCTEPNDVAYLAKWLGRNGAERIRTLDKHQFLRITL